VIASATVQMAAATMVISSVYLLAYSSSISYPPSGELGANASAPFPSHYNYISLLFHSSKSQSNVCKAGPRSFASSGANSRSLAIFQRDHTSVPSLGRFVVSNMRWSLGLLNMQWLVEYTDIFFREAACGASNGKMREIRLEPSIDEM
jgi:hypothetical protein